MIRIELTAQQAVELREILRSVLGDLRMEIASTDQKDFRDGLKEREAFIKDLLMRLGDDPPTLT
jgi:hypothetical protein